MIRPLLSLALAGALALPATAQTAAVFASADQFTNGGAVDPDPDCAFAIDGIVAWFDGGTQSIYVYGSDDNDPVISEEVVDAAAIDAAAGTDADRCRAATLDTETDAGIFVLSNSDNQDFLFYVNSDNQGDLVLQALTTPADGFGDGASGVEVIGDDVYYSVSAFFNDTGADLEDGVYKVSLTGGAGQTATPVVTDGDLSLVGLAAGSDGTLYAASNRFGGGDFQNKVVAISDPGGTPALSVFADPFDGSVFTVPSDNNRFDLDAIEVADRDGGDVLFLLNNNFSGPNGEEIARYPLDGGAPSLAASEASILTDLGRSDPGFTPAAGANTVVYDEVDDRVYILNRDDFGGADEVLVLNGAFPTAAETPARQAGIAVDAAPNPFRDRLAVTVAVDVEQELVVTVADALGREVAALYDGPAAPGQALRLGLDAGALAPGVYLVRAQTAAGVATRTVTLAR